KVCRDFSGFEKERIFKNFPVSEQFPEIKDALLIDNLWSLEKLNDQTTIQYFRASNKREKTIEQLIQRRLRIGLIDRFETEQNEFLLGHEKQTDCKDLVWKYLKSINY
ncbi:hypothetical protein BpHYR1_018216, partial [Brachionus plicatilis]